ncbi:hypothetical protein Tco_0566422 [Tanacetum coccineum]
MPYPRFTKVIISHFISKDKTISMRNMIILPTIHDDTLLGTLKFVSKIHDCQQYGALIPDDMINQDIKDSKAYKTYYDFTRKFKPSRKLFPVLEEEPAEKPKRAKKPAKKSTTVPTIGIAIRDTPSESVPKKKTPAKIDRGKVMDLLSDVALLEAAQLKKTLKKSKLETHKLHASGLDEGVGSLPKVPDEQEDKTTGADEGTGTKPRVPDVPKYSSKSENESCEDNGDDDDENNDNSDEVTKDDDDDDDDVDSDADGDNEASEKTASDKDDEEEENEEEYVCTPNSFEFNDGDEEYEELYKDVNVRLTDTKHEEQGKEDKEMTNAGHDDSTQQTKYEQVKDDEHVTLTIVHDTQKTEGPMQSLFVSSDFANQFMNLDNIPPTETEVISMMNVKVFHEEPSTQTSHLNIPVTSQIPAIVDAQLSTRLEDSIKESFRSYNVEFEKKAKDKRKRYINLVEKFVKEIIKNEVKSQLPEILPKEVFDYATPVIQSSITESLKNIVLAKFSSQPKSTYEAAASLTEFELNKILLDKIQKSKSYQGAQEHKYLYDALVKSYKLDKDLFESYGKLYSLKRDREDKDKDEDPPAG